MLQFLITSDDFIIDQIIGKYCEGYGLTSVQDNCDGGFYCTGSSTLRTPVASYASGLFTAAQGDVCPAGTYCPVGSGSPTPCDGGYYCDNKKTTLLDTSKKCAAGYYCSSGSTSPTPNGIFSTQNSIANDGTGDICPYGQFCGA